MYIIIIKRRKKKIFSMNEFFFFSCHGSIIFNMSTGGEIFLNLFSMFNIIFLLSLTFMIISIDPFCYFQLKLFRKTKSLFFCLFIYLLFLFSVRYYLETNQSYDNYPLNRNYTMVFLFIYLFKKLRIFVKSYKLFCQKNWKCSEKQYYRSTKWNLINFIKDKVFVTTEIFSSF